MQESAAGPDVVPPLLRRDEVPGATVAFAVGVANEALARAPGADTVPA